MLDEFNKAEAKAATHEVPAAPKVPSMEESNGFGDMNELSEDDFAKHLQEGMAELLGGMDGNPQLAAEFEAMMKNLTTGGGLGNLEDLVSPPPATEAEKPPAAPKAAAGSASAPEESFQDTIKKTMEKIQASGAQATAAAQEENTDDILAELMKQMSAGGLDGEGGEEDFSKMLLGMMEQLTNKDILYTPMKELNEKYPEWMKENAAKTPTADLERYKRIEKIVGEIVAKFEEKTYSDTNAADREYIVERMQLVRYTPLEGATVVMFPRVFLLVSLLTNCRCKQLAPLLQTWLVTWHLHKKRSAHQMRAVLSNDEMCFFTIYTLALLFAGNIPSYLT